MKAISPIEFNLRDGGHVRIRLYSGLSGGFPFGLTRYDVTIDGESQTEKRICPIPWNEPILTNEVRGEFDTGYTGRIWLLFRKRRSA